MKCEFCGDQGPLHLHARCHMTAPLQATLEGDILTLSCYLPNCGRKIVRFKVLEIRNDQHEAAGKSKPDHLAKGCTHT